jgi:hypothetical protein
MAHGFFARASLRRKNGMASLREPLYAAEFHANFALAERASLRRRMA